MEDKVIIFDTTLRDGEQAPGASLTPEQKLQVAHQLARLGVDVIEAGFAIASPGDFQAVNQIAKEVKGPVIASLARAIEKDIDAAAEALKPAKKKRIHTFIATSDIHIKYKLKSTRQEVLERAKKAVAYARKFTDDVEFSPEDATRSDWDFLMKVIEAAIEAGATTINIPDTVGYTTPFEFKELISTMINKVPNIDKVVLSVHCHNDLGLATANSLAAILAGARQVEVTVNGIGERAGNAALEEVVMALWTRKDFFKVSTGINTKEIYRTSKLVSHLTGFVVQPNKAIVGTNAFAHEAGIHQDGILKSRLTYEIMNPEVVGIPSSKLVLGKHSGRHALKARLEELGYKVSEKQLDVIFKKFKELADKKKIIYDEDLESLVEKQLYKLEDKYQLDYMHTLTGNSIIPTATIRLKTDDQIKQAADWGDGPVDAAYKAIEKIVGYSGELIEYKLTALTGGKDAQGEVVVRVKFGDSIITGRGTSTDIVEASVLAYIDAINRYERRIKHGKKHSREDTV